MMNPTLADLILETKARNEYSYETLAKACGGVPGAGRLHQLATKEQKTFPDPETINGLARGCKVTPMEVIKSAARSVGLNVSDGAADSVYIHGYNQLPSKLKATIQELGEQVAELAQKAGDGSERSATSMKQDNQNAPTRDELAELRRRQREADETPLDEILGYAAHKAGESELQKQDREAAKRGEESQDEGE